MIPHASNTAPISSRNIQVFGRPDYSSSRHSYQRATARRGHEIPPELCRRRATGHITRIRRQRCFGCDRILVANSCNIPTRIL